MLKNLVKSPILYTIVLQGSAQGFLLLFSVAVARSISLHDYGDFVFGFQTGQTAATIAAMGATFCLAKHFGSMSNQQSARVSTFEVHNYYLVRGGLGLLVCWLVFTIAFDTANASAPFGISALNFVLVMLMSYLTAIGKAPLGNALQAGRGLLLCLGVLAWTVFSPESSLFSVLILLSLIFSVTAYLTFALRLSLAVESPSGDERREFARQHLFSVLLTGIDLLILKIVSNEDQVAYYGVALFLSNISSFALYAVNANYTSRISRMIQQGEEASISKLLFTAAKANIVLSIPFMLVLVAVGWNIEIAYGQEYEPSRTIFFILLAGQIVNVVVGSVALVANVSGKEKRITTFISHSLIFKLTIGVLASYWFGAIGMAVVAAIANASWNARALMMINRELNLNTTIFAAR